MMCKQHLHVLVLSCPLIYRVAHSYGLLHGILVTITVVNTRERRAVIIASAAERRATGEEARGPQATGAVSP